MSSITRADPSSRANEEGPSSPPPLRRISPRQKNTYVTYNIDIVLLLSSPRFAPNLLIFPYALRTKAPLPAWSDVVLWAKGTNTKATPPVSDSAPNHVSSPHATPKKVPTPHPPPGKRIRGGSSPGPSPDPTNTNTNPTTSTPITSTPTPRRPAAGGRKNGADIRTLFGAISAARPSTRPLEATATATDHKNTKRPETPPLGHPPGDIDINPRTPTRKTTVPPSTTLKPSPQRGKKTGTTPSPAAAAAEEEEEEVGGSNATTPVATVPTRLSTRIRTRTSTSPTPLSSRSALKKSSSPLTPPTPPTNQDIPASASPPSGTPFKAKGQGRSGVVKDKSVAPGMTKTKVEVSHTQNKDRKSGLKGMGSGVQANLVYMYSSQQLPPLTGRAAPDLPPEEGEGEHAPEVDVDEEGGKGEADVEESLPAVVAPHLERERESKRDRVGAGEAGETRGGEMPSGPAASSSPPQPPARRTTRRTRDENEVVEKVEEQKMEKESAAGRRKRRNGVKAPSPPVDLPTSATATASEGAEARLEVGSPSGTPTSRSRFTWKSGSGRMTKKRRAESPPPAKESERGAPALDPHPREDEKKVVLPTGVEDVVLVATASQAAVDVVIADHEGQELTERGLEEPREEKQKATIRDGHHRPTSIFPTSKPSTLTTPTPQPKVPEADPYMGAYDFDLVDDPTAPSSSDEVEADREGPLPRSPSPFSSHSPTPTPEGKRRRSGVRFATTHEVRTYSPDRRGSSHRIYHAPTGGAICTSTAIAGHPSHPPPLPTRDDLHYAMEGLAPRGPPTSALRAILLLARTLISHAGRTACRQEPGLLTSALARLEARCVSTFSDVDVRPGSSIDPSVRDLAMVAGICLLGVVQPDVSPELQVSPHVPAIARAILRLPIAPYLSLPLLERTSTSKSEKRRPDPESVAGLVGTARGMVASGALGGGGGGHAAWSLVEDAVWRVPHVLVLFAVGQMTNPHDQRLATRARQDIIAQLKQKLREAGVLELATTATLSLLDTVYGDSSDRTLSSSERQGALEVVAAGLVCLEHLTYVSPENVATLVGMDLPCRLPAVNALPLPLTVEDDSGPTTRTAASSTTSVASALTRALAALALSIRATGDKEEDIAMRKDQHHSSLSIQASTASFRSLLALTVNVSHNQQRMCADLVAAGLLDVCLVLLAGWSGVLPVAGQAPGPQIGGGGAGAALHVHRPTLSAHVQDVTILLALLINVAECAPAVTAARLVRTTIVSTLQGSLTPGPEPSTRPSIRALRLIAEMAEASGSGGSAPVSGSGPGEVLSPGGQTVEVTLEDLSAAEVDGQLSVVESYCAILAGFAWDQEPRAAAQMEEGRFGGGCLEGLVDAIHTCRHFYAKSGAMEGESLERLGGLVVRLRRRLASSVLDTLMSDDEG